jgi:hypothetical protein
MSSKILWSRVLSLYFGVFVLCSLLAFACYFPTADWTTDHLGDVLRLAIVTGLLAPLGIAVAWAIFVQAPSVVIGGLTLGIVGTIWSCTHDWAHPASASSGAIIGLLSGALVGFALLKGLFTVLTRPVMRFILDPGTSSSLFESEEDSDDTVSST